MHEPQEPEPLKEQPRGAPQTRDLRILAALVGCSIVGALATRDDPPHRLVGAYIDPGSGSLAVQLLVSFAIGLLLYIKRVRTTILRLLRRLRGRD